MTRPEQALTHSRDAYEHSFDAKTETERESGAVTALWLQAEALSRLNRFMEADPKINEALTRIEALDPDSKLHGDILKARAAVNGSGGNVPLALEDLHNAHNIFRDLGETRSQAIVLQNLGMLYWRARDFDRVLNYYEQASEIYPHDPILSATNENNRGNAFKQMGDIVAAEAAYTRALAAIRQLGSPILELRVMTNVASAQFMLGKLEEAEQTANRGLAIRESDEGGWHSFLYGVKAQVAFARGQHKLADELITKTFEAVDLEDTTWPSRDFHDAARKIYATVGKHKLAYNHLVAASRLEQEAMTAASSMNAAVLGAKFDAANQELRIAKLQADQLRNDQLLQESETKVELVTVVGAIGGGALLLILAAVAYAFVAVRQSHKEVSEANSLLERAAKRDALTDLSNRPEFRRNLREALESRDGAVALFLLDLDKFKEVNDTLGHAAGDQLLVGVADRMRETLAEGDVPCRLGGDEFAVVIRSTTDRRELARIADLLIGNIAKPFELSESRSSVGATIGIAVGPEDGTTVDNLSRSADLALYAAKSAGRGRARLYDPSLREAADDRRRLEADLRVALSNGELFIAYQPIVNARSGEVETYEALLRWDHPQRGMVSPDAFIPIAEDAGLIHAIGSWTIRTACQTAMSWPSHVKLAVNLSALQVESEGFAATVLSALSSSGFPARRLELEVTESVFLREGAQTKEMLSRLRAMGISLALDDFGTGYSSLGYLHRADFSKIKIDRSFVRSAVAGWSEGIAVIEAIVTLASGLGMQTVAEGIESEEDRQVMLQLGCSQLQGYLFGKATCEFGPDSAPRQAAILDFAKEREALKETAAEAARA